MLRVPMVRRCRIVPATGLLSEGYLVNLNVLGAYLAWDGRVRMSEIVRLSFTLAGNDRPLELRGVVAWVNPTQSHPVHSLPPGFGVKFLDLDDESRRRITAAVEEYVRRHPHALRR
jgi:Tfp pilus assembly protein PilZ